MTTWTKLLVTLFLLPGLPLSGYLAYDFLDYYNYLGTYPKVISFSKFGCSEELYYLDRNTLDELGMRHNYPSIETVTHNLKMDFLVCLCDAYSQSPSDSLRDYLTAEIREDESLLKNASRFSSIGSKDLIDTTCAYKDSVFLPILLY